MMNLTLNSLVCGSLKLLILIIVTSCLPAQSAGQQAIFATGQMLDGLYSSRAEVGDRVEILLVQPINLPAERIFVPIGAVLVGDVIDVRDAQRGLRKGKINVKLHTLHYPNGYLMGIKGFISDDAIFEDGSLEGKVGFTNNILRAGKVGAGALVGGPIGAAVAAGTILFDKGGKVSLKEGDYVRIRIESFYEYSQQYGIRGKLQPDYVSPVINGGYSPPVIPLPRYIPQNYPVQPQPYYSPRPREMMTPLER